MLYGFQHRTSWDLHRKIWSFWQQWKTVSCEQFFHCNLNVVWLDNFQWICGLPKDPVNCLILSHSIFPLLSGIEHYWVLLRVLSSMSPHLPTPMATPNYATMKTPVSDVSFLSHHLSLQGILSSSPASIILWTLGPTLFTVHYYTYVLTSPWFILWSIIIII